MIQHGKLTFVEGTDAELKNLTLVNTLFHAIDTNKFYLYAGKEKIEISGTGEPGSDAVVTGFTGSFTTATHTITVANGLIKTRVAI